MNPRLFAIFTAISIFCLIFELIRRQRMTFKYSMLWLGVSLTVILMCLGDRALAKVSSLLGFSLLSNFVFFLSLVFIMVICLFLTAYINEQNSRTETLAQSIGILENKIRTLQEEKKSS